MRYRSLLLILLFIVTACASRRTPDPNIQIQQAVAATLAAMPVSTSPAIPTPYPSPTPFDLRGLFCEYQFCIGHPTDMAFLDLSAQQNANTPSAYTQGIIAFFSNNVFIRMVWQVSPGTADPQFLLDFILEEGIDTPVGNKDVRLVRDMNVIYTSITSTATPVLPFGGGAAWTCGERVFAWKAYTPDEASAPALFESAIARFVCNR